MADTAQVLDTVIREVDAGRRAALCVIVATRGSTPQVPGAMVCVDENAQIRGTVGGGCTEAEIRRTAHQMLAGGGSNLLTFELDEESAAENGLICGGQMDVAISVISHPTQTEPLRAAVDQLRRGEPGLIPIRVERDNGPAEYRVRLEAKPKLLIAGGGHLGKELASVAVPLGFRVTVIDDREDFASSSRFPPPVNRVVSDIERALSGWPIDANTYVVIVTRGHKHDQQALGAVLASPAKYIGMIGSRRKIKVIYDDLTREGATPAQLDRVHAPIGLDIHAITPEEIAISIAAELIKIRRVDYEAVVEGPLPTGPARLRGG
ncbi:MAG: XdhC family protein [Phycisphaerae bacterium]|jgi:xanthine dehydrogenase accessory factor